MKDAFSGWEINFMSQQGQLLMSCSLIYNKLTTI